LPLTELQTELDSRAAQGLLRRRRTLSTPQGVRITVDGKSYLSFCSNDYLGLANHPKLIEALQQGAQQYGVGSGASHLVSGHFDAHQRFEDAFAEFVGKPAALSFSTGYMANLGVVQALVGRGDMVFADKLNHASLNDAMLLSRAEVKRYRHNDMAQLAQLLGETKSGRKLVITDAVFSMDGDMAPVAELLKLCEQYDAWLLLDDAHGFGVLGEQGRGVMSHFRLSSPRIIYLATLGKASGVAGACVAAEQVVIDTLLQNGRSYIYTTASPPALSVALLASLQLMSDEVWRRERLQLLTAQLRRGTQDLPWKMMASATPIQPLLVGGNEAALALSEGLRARGIWVPAIRPPTVPQGTARLRITLSASHTETDIAELLEALHELAQEFKIARSAAIVPSPTGGGLGRGSALQVNIIGKGEPLLLIHGWGMHGGMWGQVAGQLAESHRVHSVDLPGHGGSRACTPYALDNLVQQLSAQFDEPLAIVGWSLGGQVALRWAQLHPAQVHKLALVATTPCFVQQAGWSCAMAADTLQEFAASLLQNHALTLKRFLALQLRGSENERELLLDLRARLYANGEPDIAALQGGLDILRDTDMRKQLTHIAQSTLVIAGERDTLTPSAASEYLAQTLPNARLVKIPGAAHAPFLSHPQIFMQHLTSFLNERI